MQLWLWWELAKILMPVYVKLKLCLFKYTLFHADCITWWPQGYLICVVLQWKSDYNTARILYQPSCPMFWYHKFGSGMMKWSKKCPKIFFKRCLTYFVVTKDIPNWWIDLQGTMHQYHIHRSIVYGGYATKHNIMKKRCFAMRRLHTIGIYSIEVFCLTKLHVQIIISYIIGHF